jgi:lambda repressor-like predicted transcriptional regulator
MGVLGERVRGSNERLRAAVLESGLAMEDVARQAGMDPKTLERAIAGRTPHPRNRHALAAVLQSDPTELWPDSYGPTGSGVSLSELAGVERVYTTRSDFLSDMPPETLFGGASSVVSAGLSNNLLCQHYADRRLERLIIAGAVVTCLFLDPTGPSMAAREIEEGHDAGHLSSLTTLNITHLQRLRSHLDEPIRDRLRLATYDQTIRFNIIVVKRPEAATAVVQPYLPRTRGVDSPTFVVRQMAEPGLFDTFYQVLADLNDGASPC